MPVKRGECEQRGIEGYRKTVCDARVQSVVRIVDCYRATTPTFAMTFPLTIEGTAQI